jgi:hypothetical protein
MKDQGLNYKKVWLFCVLKIILTARIELFRGLAAAKGKGRWEQCGSHQGLQRPEKRQTWAGSGGQRWRRFSLDDEVKGKWRGGTQVGGGCGAKTAPWGTFYRAMEGAERPGCKGEWWPSVGELKSMVMARGEIGIKPAVPVSGAEGLGDAWFPRRRRPEGSWRWPNGWRRHDHREEEDDGLVGLCGPHGWEATRTGASLSGQRAQWAEMGPKAGWTGRYGGLPWIPGWTDFASWGRIEKSFLDFDSRNEIQI